jgi:hypothetical protein
MLSAIILSVIMLIVIILSVIMLSVIMPKVAARMFEFYENDMITISPLFNNFYGRTIDEAENRGAASFGRKTFRRKTFRRKTFRRQTFRRHNGYDSMI